MMLSRLRARRAVHMSSPSRPFFEGISIRDLEADVPVKILKWHAKDGARVKKGDVLFEIGTIKMHKKILAKHDGIVAKIMKGEDTTVRPSTPVAIMVNDQADLNEFQKLSREDYEDFAPEFV